MPHAMHHPKTLLFLEGFVSVSLQFLFMRHLLPFIGSSVVTSSTIISIFLLALSFGYHAGGRTHQNHQSTLARNLLLSAVILSAGLSPWVSQAFFTHLSGLNQTAGLGLYCILFMAPAVFWLGQTMPLLSNAIKAQSQGELSGTVLFFSTIGNVIGSLISVMLLMRFTSLGITILVNIGVLLLLFVYLSPRAVSVAIATSVGAIALTTTVHAERSLFNMTTHYSNYRIAELNSQWSPEPVRILQGNLIAQSQISESGRPFRYIEHIEAFIDRHVSTDGRILVAGAGGFTFGRHLDGARIDFIDIDDRLKTLVEDSFLKAPINGRFIASDARQYLLSTAERYDAIVLDTFSNTYSAPGHLITREFFELARQRVKPGGIVLINTIQSPLFSDEFSRNLHATILSALPFCEITNASSTPDQDLINRVYACPVVTEDPAIFIDRVLSQF